MSKSVFKVILFIFLIGTSLFAQKQKTNVEPRRFQAGEKLPGISRIQPRKEQYISFLVRDGKKQVSSILTRSIEFTEHRGEPALRVVQRYDSPGGINTDTSIVRRNTLEPLAYNSELTTQTETFDFVANRVTGKITPKQGETKTFDEKLETPIYNSVIMNEILQSLPFSGGKSFVIRQYNPGKVFFEQTYSAVKSERIRIADSQIIDTWVVEIKSNPVFAVVSTTMWLTKRTQEQVMMKSVLKDGSEFWRVRLYSNPL